MDEIFEDFFNATISLWQRLRFQRISENDYDDKQTKLIQLNKDKTKKYLLRKYHDLKSESLSFEDFLNQIF